MNQAEQQQPEHPPIVQRMNSGTFHAFVGNKQQYARPEHHAEHCPHFTFKKGTDELKNPKIDAAGIVRKLFKGMVGHRKSRDIHQ